MEHQLNKIIVIGDEHGRGAWKKIVEKEVDASLFVFLGDYLSSHEGVSGENQLSNLFEILSFKEKNPDRVVLLRGNHDMQHLGYYWAECCALFPDVQKEMIKEENRDRYLRDTQWIYIYKDIIFSHAGISKRWFEDSECKDIVKINTLPPSELFGFRPCKMSDYYGISQTQGPTWIRPQTLIEYAIPEWRQVVGHTPVKHIVNLKDEIIKQYGFYVKNPVDIWLCDCLPHEYLVIENDEFKPTKLF